MKGELINMARALDKEVYHLYSLITTNDDFDSADLSSMQGVCHLGSNPDGDSDFSLSHARGTLINSPFAFTFGRFLYIKCRYKRRPN